MFDCSPGEIRAAVPDYADASSGLQAIFTKNPSVGVERRFGAGPVSSGNEAGEPALAKTRARTLAIRCAAPIRRSVRRFLAGDALPGSVEKTGLTANPSILVQLGS